MKTFPQFVAEKKSGDDEAYEKFYKKALKKFEVENADDLSKEKKKEFYDYIDKNWKADDEKVNEGRNTLPNRMVKDYINEGKYAKEWGKRKGLKFGNFELERGSDGMHDVLLNGKKVARFLLDDSDMWLLNHGKGKSQTFREIDDMVSWLKENESKL
jgi:hypothetical protein